jgi:hypothetical protein
MFGSFAGVVDGIEWDGSQKAFGIVVLLPSERVVENMGSRLKTSLLSVCFLGLIDESFSSCTSLEG